MILYGFSAAGVLTATMANAIPTRMMGAIEYASGSGYVNLDDILVSAAATRIPTLVLANAKDEDAGTARSYRYFLRGRVTGMPPWAYAVQNATDHCCNLSTRNLILPWIQAVASQQTSLSAANGNPQRLRLRRPPVSPHWERWHTSHARPMATWMRRETSIVYLLEPSLV